MKRKYVTLPEMIAYADENNCDLEKAADHFRSIGRMKEVFSRPVPDGYTIPEHRFAFTERALARAGDDREQVEQACEEALEEVMLEMVRAGQEGKKFTFYFHSFPFGKDGYESGYTLVPSDRPGVAVQRPAVIEVDATVFQTMRAADIEGRDIAMPILDD